MTATALLTRLRFGLTLALLAAAAPVLGADAAELRATLFGPADRALGAANEARASLLAPQSYGAGAEAYRKAESILESGGGIESIQRNLATAREQFNKAAGAAASAGKTLAGVLDARTDAQSAEAPKYAVDTWQGAEKSLAEAALRMERGRTAERDAERAEQGFREAELLAIKANYLNETRSLLEIADDLRAARYAPVSYERAKTLLAEAEQALTEDRYDTDRPRNLAQLAEHNAHHAIYVSRLQRRINDDEINLELVLLEWEGAIAKVADQLDVPVYFDAGHEDAVRKITQALETQEADISFLEQGIADRDAQIASLETEVGGQSQSLERVNEALARRERQRERLDGVEALFGPDQAIVLRRSDSVILRLIGLNFASGSPRLTDEHTPILDKVEQALADFPEANIIIEGHTDSFGSDESNQALSQARAESVLHYLLANSPLSPANVQALGYGETQPVANNETPEGRTRNRRIDIVIYPAW